MDAEHPSECTPVACPLCGAVAERGCVMSGGSQWLRWFAGPPSVWKRITAGVFISSPGDPVGGMGELCGSYVEGIRCRACDRIILEGVDPGRRKRQEDAKPSAAANRQGGQA